MSSANGCGPWTVPQRDPAGWVGQRKRAGPGRPAQALEHSSRSATAALFCSSAHAPDVSSVITFDGAPFGFPAEDPLPVHLVLMVTAHHGERDHLLGEGQAAWVTHGWNGRAAPWAPCPERATVDAQAPTCPAQNMCSRGSRPSHSFPLDPQQGRRGAWEERPGRALTRNFSFTSRSSASSSNSFCGYTSMPLDSRSAVIWG